MGSNKRFLIVIFLAVIAITIAAIGSVKGAVATEPVRPWYLEPPEVFQPTHIREGDRLYASYFNEQFNVIYNWAQLLNREWKNFTNGTGIASITANLITAKDKIVTPVISIIKGNQPAPDGNGGLIYYDKDLDRFRAYQEGAWRDLSSNVYIASDTIGSPLTIQGYLQASNIYASNTVYAHGVNNTGTLTNTGNVVTEGLNANKRLKVPTFSSTQTADSSLGKGSLYYDSTNNKLKAYNGSTWEDVAEDSGEWTTSSTTGDKTFNNGKISFASDSNLIIPRANLSYSPPVGATDTLKLHNSDLYTYDSMWKRLTGVWNAPYTSGQKRWESHGEKFYFEGNIEVGAGSRSSGNVHIVFQPDTKNYTYSDSSYLRASLTYEPTLLVGNCTEIDTNSAVGVGSLSGNITAPSFSHIRKIKESSSSGGSSDDISGPVIHIQSPSRYAIESSTIVDASGTVYAPYGLILPGEASATSKVNSLRVNNNGDLQLYYGGWKNVGASAQTVDTAMIATSTNAVQNKVIKKYVDDKTTGISSTTATIEQLTVSEVLKLPLNYSLAPEGSIAYANQNLKVKNADGWINLLTSASNKFEIKNVVATCSYSEYDPDHRWVKYKSISYRGKLIEIGDHIVVWIVSDATYCVADGESNTVGAFQLECPDEVGQCADVISNFSVIDHNHCMYKLIQMGYDTIQEIFVTAHYSPLLNEFCMEVYETYEPWKYFHSVTIPDFYLIGFK